MAQMMAGLSKMLAPAMLGMAVGSMVGEGTISALSYAWRVISLGETLLVASLLTALYPAFGAALLAITSYQYKGH